LSADDDDDPSRRLRGEFAQHALGIWNVTAQRPDI
jgi:hypothetical protein